MKIAVTGGSGELGKTLVPYLVEQGHTVLSIDLRLPQPAWGSPSLRYWIADTRHFGELVGSLEGCEGLIHLAAIRSPSHHPAYVVYNDNTQSNYNALQAAATLGIKRVVLASSVNAIGGPFSRVPRYDYFPLDENHPTYAEDPYSLSKWVGEMQADAFARRYEDMSIASMRFHWLVESYDRAVEWTPHMGEAARKHMWSYTLLSEASRACLLALTADFQGHEEFFILAPHTAVAESSALLAKTHYPHVQLRSELAEHQAFYDCSKAERILGWKHIASR
jgi:UDP-glucose 4-epimerase